jgi:hypothetical protein
MYIEIVSTETQMTKINEKIECPKCKGGTHTKKGKTSNKQFQRLQCKKCNKQFQIEVSIYDKQMKLPEISVRIVKFPKGGYAVCKINIIGDWVHCLELLSEKVKTYKDIIALVRKNKNISVDLPGAVELDQYIPQTMINDLNKLFGSDAQKWVNLLDAMAK